MSMLVRVLEFTGYKPSSIEAEINNACAELVKEGRFVVSVDVFDMPANRLDGGVGARCAMIKHMKDDTVDYMRKAIDAENALERIAQEIRPLAKPEDESYDDTESAYSNGIDVANWETAERIDAVLTQLRS